ncbi:polymorphic toxin type 28 domain-containing protein [Nocardia sp. NPDC052566]|uniref:polymorphic toxin type 28 domain-containing protein n=1 Tax=Nocardia sp. NPDC052566 TaxID=3364330 RepID=UPI0037C5F059
MTDSFIASSQAAAAAAQLGGRVHNFEGMTESGAVARLERIYAGEDLIASARSLLRTETTSAGVGLDPLQPVVETGESSAETSAPPVAAGTGRPPIRTIGFEKGLGSEPAATPEEQTRQNQANNALLQQQVEEARRNRPPQRQAPLDQMFRPDGVAPAPPVSVPSGLGELSGVGAPPAAANTPTTPADPAPADPGQPAQRPPTAYERMFAGLPGNSHGSEQAAPTASVPSSLGEMALPGNPDYRPSFTVSASCETGVPPTPGVVPESITNPMPTFRIEPGYTTSGYHYTPEQFAADMATVRNGPYPWKPGSDNPYDAAYQRLSMAQYSIEEQSIDLRWAHFDARTQEERDLQTAAMGRLRQAGIPWHDPAIAKFIHDRDKVPVLNDPSKPARWAPPRRFTNAELLEQIKEANRTSTTLRELANGAIDDMFIEPSKVLWQAAHGEGDHSAWDITWAATKLGVNVVLTVPGPGAAAAAGAKLAVRRMAPEFWEAMTSAETAAQAVRVGSEFHTKQLLDDITTYNRTHIPPNRLAPPDSIPRNPPPMAPEAAPKLPAPRAEMSPAEMPTFSPKPGTPPLHAEAPVVETPRQLPNSAATAPNPHTSFPGIAAHTPDPLNTSVFTNTFRALNDPIEFEASRLLLNNDANQLVKVAQAHAGDLYRTSDLPGFGVRTDLTVTTRSDITFTNSASKSYNPLAGQNVPGGTGANLRPGNTARQSADSPVVSTSGRPPYPPGSSGGTGRGLPEQPSARDLGLREDAQRALDKFENIKEDPVGRINSEPNHNHYDAARREARGEVVAEKSPGVPFDHIADLMNARNGLDRIRRVLEREIANPPNEMTERGLEVSMRKKKEVTVALDRLNGFLHSIGRRK